MSLKLSPRFRELLKLTDVTHVIGNVGGSE